MNTHTAQTREATVKSASNENAHTRSNDDSASEFVDNRAEAGSQNALQEMADNSPVAQQQKAIQEMANDGTQARTSQSAVQLKDGVVQMGGKPGKLLLAGLRAQGEMLGGGDGPDEANVNENIAGLAVDPGPVAAAAPKPHASAKKMRGRLKKAQKAAAAQQAAAALNQLGLE